MNIWRDKMVTELYNLDINQKELEEMIFINNDILNLDKKQIEKNINILKELNLAPYQIKNIIISNPFYLSRVSNDVTELIKQLLNYGFQDLNLLFDANPFFLNKDAFEIRDYIEKGKKEGKSIENSVEELYENPFII